MNGTTPFLIAAALALGVPLVVMTLILLLERFAVAVNASKPKRIRVFVGVAVLYSACGLVWIAGAFGWAWGVTYLGMGAVSLWLAFSENRKETHTS